MEQNGIITRETEQMIIRPEHPNDYNAILRLTYEAFLTLDYPGRRRMGEHYLIYLLQGSTFVIPELCFVAEQDGEIVGHILYTKSEILRPDDHYLRAAERPAGTPQAGDRFRSGAAQHGKGARDGLRCGFGKEMIAQMLTMLRKAGARTVIVEPERDNTASNRALEANGFLWNGEDCHLELEDAGL